MEGGTLYKKKGPNENREKSERKRKAEVTFRNSCSLVSMKTQVPMSSWP